MIIAFSLFYITVTLSTAMISINIRDGVRPLPLNRVDNSIARCLTYHLRLFAPRRKESRVYAKVQVSIPGRQDLTIDKTPGGVKQAVYDGNPIIGDYSGLYLPTRRIVNPAKRNAGPIPYNGIRS